ncbi:hypothetical protein B0H67DRAFT_648220 [Lasiosphaeris hirsuta]|uniref:Uncharacterized protein n=1 Tax=Lasiosphaeris hirsuta TaxID=260670 RepID=A0AA40DLI5_9PEZI|nr:hypothetical protein B0H67DRAFT_648220 [Lasiosphaeris hirsuta]
MPENWFLLFLLMDLRFVHVDGRWSTVDRSTAAQPCLNASDWPTWNCAFQVRAERLHVWELVRPGATEPWPKRPKMPSLNCKDYHSSSASKKLDPTTYENYQRDRDDYFDLTDEWDDVDKRLQELGEWMQLSIDADIYAAFIGPGKNLCEAYAAFASRHGDQSG